MLFIRMRYEDNHFSLTIITSHLASEITFWLTEPRKKAATLPSPRDPITKQSAFNAWDCSRRISKGEPWCFWNVALRFVCCFWSASHLLSKIVFSFSASCTASEFMTWSIRSWRGSRSVFSASSVTWIPCKWTVLSCWMCPMLNVTA